MKERDASGFGDRLKRSRIERSITQSELGRLLGLSQETIASYEGSGRFPRSQTLRSIARLFGISLDELLGNREAAKGQDPEAWDTSPADFGLEGLIAILRRDPLDRAFAYSSAWKATSKWTLLDLFQCALIPLLQRVGQLWQKGELSVAEEHLISDKVRELSVLYAHAERSSRRVDEGDERRWMGLCVPAEKHELALFMLSLLLRQAGWRIWYLGTQVPLADLIDAIAKYRPKVLGFSITMQENMEGLEYYAGRIRERFGPHPAIIVGGQGAVHPGPRLIEIVDAFTTSIDEGLALAQRLGESTGTKSS